MDSNVCVVGAGIIGLAVAFELARAGGATLAGGGHVDAHRVVVCAGPDTYRLLGLAEPARLRSVRFSFALRERLEASAPCWVQRDDALSEPFYRLH